MVKVVSTENMRLSDANTIKTKISSLDLMWNAAYGVFKSVRWGGNIAIVCGTGNNAGDGYALAIILKEHKINSTLLLIEDKYSEDGKYYFDKAKTLGIKSYIINKETSFKYNIIVDCLLGTGFKGTPKDKYLDVINKINKSKAYVVSVDINSGLNGNNGLSEASVKSNLTVSIGSFKYGHFLNQAMDVMKSKVNVDIGIDIIKDDALLIERSDLKDFFKPREHFSNKGTYGYVGIIGGSENYPGAIKLASMGQAALRVGAGVSRVIVPNEIANQLYPNVLETTVYPLVSENGHIKYDEQALLASISGLKAISIGPGIGQSADVKKVVEYLVKNVETPLLIDADGLNALSTLDLSILKDSKAKIVLTPHLKEFSRLTRVSVKEIEADPVRYVTEFVNTYPVTLLLKGPTTIIANKDKMYFVDRGAPGMATAGSGDVLTGIITGLLGYNQEDILLTVAAGAFINGLAGEIAASAYGEVSMIASDTVSSIAKAILKIRE